MTLLNKVNCPKDVKKLNKKELEILCDEIRQEIISVTTENGGHLSSNLGIVELIVAIHYVFDTPNDKLIFDVGHQCYAHKILTERKKQFSSIRKKGGISGFIDSDESEYDTFSSGHAGNSLGFSLGTCFARDKLKKDYKVIDIVGDGALSNGLNLEALTSTLDKPKNLLVILNDNGMSISKNKNGLYYLISKGTIKNSYIKTQNALKRVLGHSFLYKFLSKTKNFIKRIFNRNYVFEKFGFKYVGVGDGNDVVKLIDTLKKIKNSLSNKAVLFHVKTVKGKGLDKAEEHSDLYHGIGKNLEIKKGEFSSKVGEILNDLIDKDDSIVAITAGMKDGTGLNVVEEKHKNNVIDVGIAEEHAVTLASGMAKNGLKPFVCVYSTFLQRAYDEIINDVCISNLPVIFLIDRAGFSGQDGKTHQGLFDLSYLNSIPNLTVFAPNNFDELKEDIINGLKLKSPVAIRYPASNQEKSEKINFEDGFNVIEKGKDACIFAVGPNMLRLAKGVKNAVKEDVGIISARKIKPLNVEFLNNISYKKIITLEENNVIGGFGSVVSQFYSKNSEIAVYNFGVKDCFIPHGEVSEQLKDFGFTEKDVIEKAGLTVK